MVRVVNGEVDGWLVVQVQSADRLAANQKGTAHRPRKCPDACSTFFPLSNSSQIVAQMLFQCTPSSTASVFLFFAEGLLAQTVTASLLVDHREQLQTCPKSTFWRGRSKYHRSQTANRRDPRDHSLIAVSCRCLQGGKVVAHFTSWLDIPYLSGG